MKKIFAISLAILSLAAATSCRRGGVDSDRPKDHIRFTVGMDQYSKATDNAFENGDEVGIFALDPINAANVKGTISGSTLTPATDIMWVDKQTVSTDFVAYLPYDASLATTTKSFTVKTNQSAYADYQASDLLASAVNAAPGSTVAFNLKHQLSKLVVLASCEDTEDAVKSIEIGSLAIEATADLKSQTVAAGSNKAAVTMGKAVAGNGGQGFVAILVPQTVQLELTVVTEKGVSAEFKLAAPATLTSGKSYTAEVLVKKTITPQPASPVDFTISISDWDNGGDLTFIDKNASSDDNDHLGQWSVIGLGNKWDDGDVWMEEVSDGVWETNITYAEGDEFKLRQDGKWTSEDGTEVHAEAGLSPEISGAIKPNGEGWDLWGSNGGNITLEKAGQYRLRFVTEGYKLYVRPLVTEVYILGDATEVGWSLDVMDQSGKFTESDGGKFTWEGNLTAGKEFRFPLQQDWWPSLIYGGEGKLAWGWGDDEKNQVPITESGKYRIVITLDKENPFADISYSITQTGEVDAIPWVLAGTVYTDDATVGAWAKEYPLVRGDDGLYRITFTYDESMAGDDASAKGFLIFQGTASNMTEKMGLWPSDGGTSVMNIGYSYGLKKSDDAVNILLITEADGVQTPVSGKVELTLSGVDIDVKTVQ